VPTAAPPDPRGLSFTDLLREGGIVAARWLPDPDGTAVVLRSTRSAVRARPTPEASAGRLPGTTLLVRCAFSGGCRPPDGVSRARTRAQFRTRGDDHLAGTTCQLRWRDASDSQGLSSAGSRSSLCDFRSPAAAAAWTFCRSAESSTASSPATAARGHPFGRVHTVNTTG